MKWYFLFLIVLIGCTGRASLMQPSVSFGDVVDTAGSGGPVFCSTDVGDQTSTIYLMGDLFRLDTMPANAHVIYSGDKMYSWNHQFASVVSLSGLAKSGRPASRKSAQEIVLDSHKTNSVCDVGKFGNEMFVPPTNITFTDVTPS